MANDEKQPHLIIEKANTKTRTFNGGGGGSYVRASYEAHAKQIYAEAQRLVAATDEATTYNPTSRNYFRVRMPDEIPFWTSTGAGLADALHANIVASPEKSVAHVSTTRSGLDLVLEQLERYATAGVGKSKFATIDELGLIPLTEKLSASFAALLGDDEREVSALIALFRDLTPAECNAVALAMDEMLRQDKGKIVSRVALESGYYVRVRAKARAVRRLAESFVAVQSVDRVDTPELELSAIQGEPLIPSFELVPNDSDAIVGMFDGGVVKGSRFLDGSVVEREEPLGPAFSYEHGTFVASRIIFGDTLVEQNAAGKFIPDVRVMSVCVIPVDENGNARRIKTEQLMVVIRDTVARWATQIRVFNLSINLFPVDRTLPVVADPERVSPLAAELDLLARKHRVLFVISAGNYPLAGELPPVKRYPDYFADDETRIVSPAEAVLAITVGALSEKSVAGAIALKNQPAPFTRRGPGASQFRKPDVVAHGGNLGTSWNLVDDIATVGIGAEGDRLARGNGTSYAAPLVSRMAAQLFAAIPNATPELVRALIIHYSRALHDELSSPYIADLLGNGRPDHALLLTSSQWAQAFIHFGEMAHREIRHVAFYVPNALAARACSRRVCIRATVAYTPEMNHTRKTSYCASNILCKLKKLNAKQEIVDVTTHSGPDVIRNRYAGIVRFSRTFSAGISGGHWELALEHQSRWGKHESVPFAAVVTVEDPRCEPTIDILQAIRNEVPNEYKTELRTRSAIRIRP